MLIELPTDADPVKVLCGDCLDIIPHLPVGSVSALVTDPPYSSGGAFRGDRMGSTIAKYVQSGQQTERTEFGGDTRDQRAFFAWSSLWLSACRVATVPGGAVCCFIDWRQLPVMTDAIQSGGWTWRNLATWWKPGVRMQRGRFSGSAEYVVYGSNGASDSDGQASPQNVFSCQPVGGDDKTHIAEKPLEVMKWVLSVTPPGALVLDPFGGSGSTAIACLHTGRRCIVIEQDPRYCETIRQRVRDAMGEGVGSFLVPAVTPSLFPED